MAISPNVNAYMQQGYSEEPAMGQGEAVQSVDQAFEQRFTEQAYNTLRAKFPDLIARVVTLKTLASNIEENRAFGVFVIESGNNLVYLPVVMSDGSITSCEMIYDKDEDQFLCLNETSVKDILSKSETSDPRLLQNSVRVEDTRRLFNNILRPPQSSNVVLAGQRNGILDLPDACKEQLSTYLTKTDPALLGKVASFYNVEYLASQLTVKKPVVKQANYKPQTFFNIDTITKEASSNLTSIEKKKLLRDGYLVKGASDTIVVPEDKFAEAAETEMRLTMYSGKDCCGDILPLYEGDLVTYDSVGVNLRRSLIFGNKCILTNGKEYNIEFGSSVLVNNFSDIIYDLSKYESIVPLEKIKSKIKARSFKLYCIVPGKIPNTYTCISLFSFWKDTIMVSDNALIDYNSGAYYINDNLKKGYIIVDKNKAVIPRESLFYVDNYTENDDLHTIKSFDVLRNLISSFSNKITKTADEVSIRLTDKRKNTSRCFTNTKLAAEYLHNEYGLGDKQIKTVLNNRDTLVFKKEAFFNFDLDKDKILKKLGYLSDDEVRKIIGNIPEKSLDELMYETSGLTEDDLRKILAGVPFEKKSEQLMPQGMYQQPAQPQVMPQQQQAMMAQQQQQPQPQMQNLNQFADVAQVAQDPSMFDVGVLATFADYPDIKQMLVDYLPDFLTAEDKIGRILLLFCSQKKEIEDFYGTEKCSTLMASCRRIFRILSDLIMELKHYINMV